MTRDVLRDLLDVKTDMNNVVSMLDHQQINQLVATACRKNVEAEEMEGSFILMRVVTEPFKVAMLYYTKIKISYSVGLARLRICALKPLS
jgi:exoribonuclease II